jgi:archaellum component FlaG (FlaF/FlaG flagellin family)
MEVAFRAPFPVRQKFKVHEGNLSQPTRSGLLKVPFRVQMLWAGLLTQGREEMVASIVFEGNTEDVEYEDEPNVPKSPLKLSTLRLASDLNSIYIVFTGPLDPKSVQQPTSYTVLVNGNAVQLEGATYNAVENSISLALPQGLLQHGDRVSITWTGLLDMEGRQVTGQVPPFRVP